MRLTASLRTAAHLAGTVAANLHIKAPAMTAGVQNIDQAAYLPPPPSASTSDAKTTGTPDGQTSDTQGKPQDFQSELERQGAGPQETRSTRGSETRSAKSGSAKPGSENTGKKPDTQTEDSNLAQVMPVQAAEPQKQILPLALSLAKPDENTAPDEHPVELASQDKPELHVPITVKTEAAAKTALPPSADRPPKPIPAANAVLAAGPDVSPVQILPAAPGAPVTNDSAQDLSKASANPGASSQNQPVSRAELKLPDAAPPEPVATAVQKTADATQSSPSALAFAARMPAVLQKAGQADPANPSQPAAVPSSPTPARIPVRYAATAQILQNDELDKDAGAKDPGPAVDRSVRTDARTDMVVPRIEISRDAPPSSGSAAPQQAAPTARQERIIEPPPAPPTSANDIRVRVPDNNGGSTQVRFVESGGEVRVSVRTADEGLAQTLRGHLNDLTQRLADGGMPAEIWKPASTAASSQNNQHQPDREGRESGGQQSDDGQGGQQDRRERRPAWLEEMETSLHAPKE